MTKEGKTSSIEERSIPITKEMVWKAYKKVRLNRGSAGVDGVSLELFHEDLEKQLYKIWNRLSSGSYFPPSVREMLIPKKDGKKRKLGIPTVGDRIAQQVVKSYLEPRLEEIFHKDSYGYRPVRSAHDAISAVRSNVRHYAWVVDMDIKGFFDEVDHDLLIRGLECHVSESWILLYVKRWLEAPVRESSGVEKVRLGLGTPQGGVISPLLANLYLHYALDQWISKCIPEVSFVRYADDIVIHCNSEQEANSVLKLVKERLASCKLRLHEGKSKIVHCQDYRREKKYYARNFDFLGFSFQPRPFKSSRVEGSFFLGFDCAINATSKKKILSELRATKFHRWSNGTVEDLSELLNPKLRGWTNYYGKFGRNELLKVFRVFHKRLIRWLLNRYKSLKGSVKRAYAYLKQLQRGNPNIFYHWQKGYLVL